MFPTEFLNNFISKLIIHNDKLYITFKSYLLNAFPICLASLCGTKPKTIFQNSLELTLQFS